MNRGTSGGFLAFGVGVLAAALGLLAVRLVLPEVGGPHEDPHVVVAGYAAAVAIVYSVLLAFTVVVVWEQLNKTRRLVEEEGDRLETLWRLFGRFSDQVAGELRASLHRYGATTSAAWRQEMYGSDEPDAPDEALAIAWRGLLAVPPRTRGEQVVHRHAVDRLDEFSRVRAERRLADSERLHPMMWALLAVGAVVTIGATFLFVVQDLWLQALLSALVGGVIGLVLFVIHDLDDPFDGVWRIGPEPIERAVGVNAAPPDPRTALPRA